METNCPIIWAKPLSKNEKRPLLVDVKELECLCYTRTRTESRNGSSTRKCSSAFHTEKYGNVILLDAQGVLSITATHFAIVS